VRVMGPSKGCVELDTTRGRAKVGRDGSFDLNPADVKRLVAAGGFVPSMQGVASKSDGYRCTGCGFGTWFKRCSRCGGHCERES
jgi:hypothetical protein